MARLEKATVTYWRDAAIAGAIGGLVMLVYTTLAEGWIGLGVWTPVDVLAALIPGLPAAIPGYGAIASVLSAFLHVMTAAAWGLGYGAFLALLSTYGPPRMARSWTVATLMGLGWGVAVYAIMGLVAGPALGARAFLINPTTYFVAHLICGLVTGLALTSLSRRPRVVVTFAPDEAPVRTTTRR